MAVTSYDTLKTAIGAYTHRDDLSAYYDEFIDLAESNINAALRVSEMESSTSVAVTTSALALPDGFLEMREINVSGSPNTTLEYLTPHQLNAQKGNESGRPRYYTIKGDAIELYPAGSYTIDMVYYKSITPLDNTNTTNFVLTRFPEIYLHGTLQWAYTFAQDDQRMQMHSAAFNAAIANTNKMSNRRKFSGAPLQVVAA